MQSFKLGGLKRRCLAAASLAVFGAIICPAQVVQQAVLSQSAYRALGQPDLRQNGVNMVAAGTLAGPQALALDSAGHLYVADTFNHRVQAWANAGAFQTGAPADLILGQPTPQHSNQLGIGVKGFSYPFDLAVNPTTMDLYVADYGDNRVLRFPKPFANPTRVEPDAVYGQPDFNTRTPDSSGVTARTMRGPRGVAFDGQGNLWVADAGNNRVLRFPAGVLNNSNPSADLVLGQPDFLSAGANRGGAISAAGFNMAAVPQLVPPVGLAFDAQNNLYVADFQNTRVLKFPAPLTSASVATIVYGQTTFTARGVPQVPTASSLDGPAGVAVDASGNLFVAIPLDNRILMFAAGAASGDKAKQVFGQPDFATSTVNTGSFPQASATSLNGAGDVKVDAQGNVYAADSGNNRLLSFPAGSKSAGRVLGQNNFATNGPNQIKPGSINAPYKIAEDYSHSPFALYVSDTNNNRVLVWRDGAHFLTGASADLIIGQPDFTTAVPNVDSGGKNTPTATSLSAPRGIAVASDGTLYVADSGNHRVLRYPRPVDQSGRIAPDAVLGQADFTSAASAAVSAASLRNPAGVAIGPNGNILIADSGNNRVLEFPAGASTGASAVRVYGQPSFNSSALPGTVSAQTLVSPQGLVVDAAYNLYICDSGANRVVVYPGINNAPPVGLAASIVIGQA
ncbi:MAG TPA: NHL repeat-containing protein, partial [Bryobacteraceae bacterium]|nr:NHL repeat-containing protein [Bryobacteraceae bacterium]